MRALATTWHDQGAGRKALSKQRVEAVFQELADYVAKRTDEELYSVSHAFPHFLAIPNATEGHHRCLKQAVSEKSWGRSTPSLTAAEVPFPIYWKSDTFPGSIKRSKRFTEQRFFQLICWMNSRIVIGLYSHPFPNERVLQQINHIEDMDWPLHLYFVTVLCP